nr:MAG TPA: hypothetical protein [Caudoviricetes sp.]
MFLFLKQTKEVLYERQQRNPTPRRDLFLERLGCRA